MEQFGKPTKKSFTIIKVDSFLALGLGTAIALLALPNVNQFLNIMVCSFVSVLPDVVEAPYYFFKKKGKTIEKWIGWQKSIQFDVKPKLGLVIQAVVILVALWWIFN